MSEDRMFIIDPTLASAQAFAIGSSMISASHSQSLALEAAVAQLTNQNILAMATAAQCVSRVHETSTQKLGEMLADILGQKL